jgi:hypothetical protein
MPGFHCLLWGVLHYIFVIARFTLRRLATFLLLLISQPNVALIREAGCPGFIFYVGARYTYTSDNMNLNLQFVTLALPIVLAHAPPTGRFTHRRHSLTDNVTPTPRRSEARPR